MWRLISFLAVLTFACAPRPTPAPPPAAAITTDLTRYVLRPAVYGHVASIVARFTAPADTAVFILHCNGAISWGLQRLVDGRWENAWVATTNGCLSAPIQVTGGGTYADTLELISRTDMPPNPGTVQAEVPPGTYRVVWFGVLTAFDLDARPFGDELGLEHRVSAPIVIERAP